jgi:hypothetical protein
VARETLEKQVHRLVRRVDMLERLPERVGAMESQILQLRGDVAVLRTEMHELHATTIRVVEALHVETNRRMEASNVETNRRMEELNVATRRHMLVLHEEVIDRIGRLGEV